MLSNVAKDANNLDDLLDDGMLNQNLIAFL